MHRSAEDIEYNNEWEADAEGVRTLLVGALLALSAIGLIGMVFTRARRGKNGGVANKKGDVAVGLRNGLLARDVESKVSPADSADSPADTAPLIAPKKDK